MKRCPVCGERYEDVYTTCSDGAALEIDSDNTPLAPRNSPSFESKRPPAKLENPKAFPNVGKKIAAPPKSPSPSGKRSGGAGTAIRLALGLGVAGLLVFAVRTMLQGAMGRARQKQVMLQTLISAKATQGEAINVLKSTNAETAIIAQEILANDLGKAAAQTPNVTKPIIEAVARWSRKFTASTAQLTQAQQMCRQGSQLQNVKTSAEFQGKKRLIEKACDIWDREANMELHAQDDLHREMSNGQIPSEAMSRFFANNKVLIALKAIQQHGLALQKYSQSVRALSDVLASNMERPNDAQTGGALQPALDACNSAVHDLTVALTNAIAAAR